MNSQFDNLFFEFKKTGLILDTNLWVLLLIGTFKKSLIETYKRTRSYREEDFEILLDFVSKFKLVITPHILTEITNLTDSINKEYKSELFSKLSKMVTVVEEMQVYPSLSFMGNVYLKHGLSDSATYQIGKDGYLVVTDDLPLYHHLIASGIKALNFNHLRSNSLLN